MPGADAELSGATAAGRPGPLTTDADELPAAEGEVVLDPTRLLTFFAEQGRDLPWRRADAGPWGVMVSEFMLQQTPVVRVLPVFDEWMTRWPSPRSLAADSPGDAVRAWGRLGYPRRALRLHATATAVTVDFGGRIPGTVPELLLLPGIGEYTARAIAAFAFRARTPVIDTNVRRVLSRAVRGVDSIREPATAADRRELESLLPDDPPTAATFSAAVMEVGALVCTASNPRCPDCPIGDLCRWRAAGRPAALARRAAQSWAGTDRQVRGRIMALLRAAHGPVPAAEIALAWPVAEQRHRCLSSLVADGLAAVLPDGSVALPS